MGSGSEGTYRDSLDHRYSRNPAAPRAVRRCETGRAGQNEKNDLELKARNQAHSVHLGIFQLHGYHETRSPSGRDFPRASFSSPRSGPPSAPQDSSRSLYALRVFAINSRSVSPRSRYVRGGKSREAGG